ncbi:hypothetical protein J2T17_007817 [Paenibacillus mucilaginosus]
MHTYNSRLTKPITKKLRKSAIMAITFGGESVIVLGVPA